MDGTTWVYLDASKKIVYLRNRRFLKTSHIIRVDGVDDVEAYNNYDQMPLFTDFPKKISVVEKNLPKDIMLWERKGVKGKVVIAG